MKRSLTGTDERAWKATRENGCAVSRLIGRNGFDRAKYDALTGPLRRAIGSVHPDDDDPPAWDEGSGYAQS